MIHVPSDIFATLQRPSESTKLRPKVVWTQKGGLEPHDFSSRLIAGGLGQVNRSTPANLGAGKVSTLVVTLDNADGYLSLRGGGGVFNLAENKYMLGSPIEIWVQVWGPATGWYDIPVYKGYSQSLEERGDLLEVKVQDAFTALTSRKLTESYDIDPTATHGEAIRDFLTTYTSLVAGDLDVSGSFAFAEARQAELDWTPIGTIREGTKIGTAVSRLASSGFGTLFSDESGTVIYDAEFPDLDDRTVDTFPEKITEKIAWDIEYVRDVRAIATRSGANGTAGTGTYYESGDTLESHTGQIYVQTAMPYLLWYRCQRLAARIVWEKFHGMMDYATWGMGPLGALLQLNDRAVVVDPKSGSEDTYRVRAKIWDGVGTYGFAGVLENHAADYLSGDILEFGTTAWTAADEEWL